MQPICGALAVGQVIGESDCGRRKVRHKSLVSPHRCLSFCGHCFSLAGAQIVAMPLCCQTELFECAIDVCASLLSDRDMCNRCVCVFVFECAIDVCASQRVQSMHRLHVTCLLVARAPAPWSSPLFLHRCHGEEGSCSCDISGFDATNAGVPEGHFIYSLVRV